jgi:hypothetical protein
MFGRPKPASARGEGLAEERKPPGTAVAHGGLGDRDRQGEKAVLLLEEAAHVEPTILRRSKLRRSFGVGRVLRSGRIIGSGGVPETEDGEQARRETQSYILWRANSFERASSVA